MFKRCRQAAVIAAVFSLSTAPLCFAIVGSDTAGQAAFSGTDIGSFTGATSFYNAGYTGSGVIIANIEGGWTWNGHETTSQGQIPQYFADPSVTGQFDRHATWVGQTMIGRGNATYQKGIAYNATLWSGQIASSFASAGTGNYSGNFTVTTASLFTPYYNALLTGVNSQGTADVVNSSWGSASGQDGNSYSSVMVDAFTFSSSKLVVFSAGNAGSSSNTIYAPESGFNGLVVGATSSATTKYNAIASFSSVSPTDVYNPSTNTTIAGARARVDIVAPGASLLLAHYGGATGGNQFGGAVDSSTVSYEQGLSGTSFASPSVASGAALITNVGKSQYVASNSHATDGRVIKSVLMNSANPLSGYNNGQATANGVVTTTQSLDYTQGAGQMSLSRAYTQYTTGTTGTVTASGGAVTSSGWAYGEVAASANMNTPNHNDYAISSVLAQASTLTLTVTWFSHDVYDASMNVGFDAFDNLDLKVFRVVNNTSTLVAQSISTYNSSEHLSFSIPTTGSYTFSVYEDGYLWNGINGITDTSTPYGIAWNYVAAVPEPTTGTIWLVTTSLCLRRRRVTKSVISGSPARV